MNTATAVVPPVLEVSNLRTHFRTSRGINRAVDGMSFTMAAGETLAIVGESGCGKSVTSMSVMRLIAPTVGRSDGSVRFNGRELLTLPEAQMRRIRGREISMIFQEPMTSLNPVLRIGDQIAEVLRVHRRESGSVARDAAVALLESVGIPSAAERYRQYPHQLSGGMRQRVMIAMALACHPKLLIADEPTTALDVTVQAQILELMRALRERLGTAVLLITHDLGVVAEVAERVLVMYAGRPVEEAPVRRLFQQPAHPYTLGLIGAVPRIGSSLDDGPRTRLAEIPGRVPDLTRPLAGCAFAPRCPRADDDCERFAPPLLDIGPGHRVACHHAATGSAAGARA